jgi:hypothetical protein
MMWKKRVNRIYQELLAEDPVGDPILTTLIQFQKKVSGIIAVSDNGISWRLVDRVIAGGSYKNKWIRWHDVARIIPENIKKGKLKLEMYKRKNGALIMNKKGEPKRFRWRFWIGRAKGEPKKLFKAKRKDYYRLMNEIFEKNKTDEIPLISDSRF